MSYYRPSFSQTVAMTRGRGFSSSRGSSYRGNRGGSSWNDRRGGGSYNSPRGSGGGKFSSGYNNFDSRSKYGSSHGNGDRYSSRGRSDGFRRPSNSYRSEGSFRDSSSHRSPDRKRSRQEAPSSRRSHDGGGGGYGGDNSYRYENHNSSYSEKSRNSISGGGGGGGDRRPASNFRSRGGDDYRKIPSATTRYRGRIGSRPIRGTLRRDGIRRRMVESSYPIKRRIISRSNQDYMRRVKINRLRSAATSRRIKSSKSSEKETSDKEENWDDEDEDAEADEEKKSKKKEEDGSDDNKDEEDDEKKVVVKKSGSVKEGENNEEEEGEGKKTDGESSPSKEKKEKKRMSAFKYSCPHCYTGCKTYADYSSHLYSGKHVSAMRRIATKQKQVLAKMRLTQRNIQREVEKSGEDLASRSSFCVLCKLNYRQLKSKHQSSEAHKNMKKFLMPYCRICRITFKSPMLYENHVCSLDHLKRKAAYQVNGDKSDKEEHSGNEEMNLDNFMTIDSVGDVDDDDQAKDEKKDGESGSPHKKEKINVGVEHIRKIEVHYCELCRIYLPRGEEEAYILTKHCSSRNHLQKYVRYKEDNELRKQAERLQRKETAEKEERKDKDKEKKDDSIKTEDGEESSKEKEGGENIEKTNVASSVKVEDEEDCAEDKLWTEDVDKEINNLLDEANAENKSSDEDDDSHAEGERYDRFRYSKKSGDEDETATAKKVECDEEEDPKESSKEEKKE